MLVYLPRASLRVARSAQPFRSIPFSRAYSTLPKSPSPVKLVAELRKRTTVSLQKAREALAATSNDVEEALKWLEKDMVASGEKKAAKLEGRTAGCGVIGTVVMSDGTKTTAGGIRAAMIELNCETDFVARNELFSTLALDIAHTAAFLAEAPVPPPKQPSSELTKLPRTLVQPLPIPFLNDAILLSHSMSSPPSSSTTVSSSIREAMTKLGEKVSLRRAVSIISDPLPGTGLQLGSFVHGAVAPSKDYAKVGSLASLVTIGVEGGSIEEAATSDEFLAESTKLARSAARQIVGFETESLDEPTTSSSSEPVEGSTVLYDQPAMMFQGSSLSVREYLKEWSSSKNLGEGKKMEVLEFVRWKAGEGIVNDSNPADFAEEVRRLQQGS